MWLALYETAEASSRQVQLLCLHLEPSQRQCMFRDPSLYEGVFIVARGWKERSRQEPCFFIGSEKNGRMFEALHWGRGDLIGILSIIWYRLEKHMEPGRKKNHDGAFMGMKVTRASRQEQEEKWEAIVNEIKEDVLCMYSFCFSSKN